MRRAWSVVDLGFGDAGKGALTDHLVRTYDIGCVVRFNGGAQAGHNVVAPDGRHHTFSQFGSGTFAGATTMLSADFLLHPLGMAVEADYLGALGLDDPFHQVSIHANARVITPYQQAANRARESLRGDSAHGSCGVGIGECARDALLRPEQTIRARHLGTPAARALLEAGRRSKRAELEALGVRDLSLFDDARLIDRVVEAWRDVATRLERLEDDAFRERLHRQQTVVFEGAQGVLLDEWWGFHPHTTYSDCTASCVGELWDGDLHRYGLTRSYQVRHGAGPMPTDGVGGVRQELHNNDQSYQGTFRVGALDANLLRYALSKTKVDELVVSHLDQVSVGMVCPDYVGGADLLKQPSSATDLEFRERVTQSLFAARPRVERAAVVPWLEAQTGVRVGIEGWGPSQRRTRTP